jgi:choline dehydrogenase-like flavoprotein
MGSSKSPFAVTDGKERVYGVDGLRVVDISLFPSMLTSCICV